MNVESSGGWSSRRIVNTLVVAALIGAMAAIVLLGPATPPAAAHVPVCTINSVGGRVVCHANVYDDALYAKAVDTSGFCPSDYWRVSTTNGAFQDVFAANVCDTGARGSSNYFCIGCRPTNISIDNKFATPVGTRYSAWHS